MINLSQMNGKIEILENEMKNLIIKNNELSSIIKFYQANLSRLSLQIDSDMHQFVNQNINQSSSIYTKRALPQQDYFQQEGSKNLSYQTENELNLARIHKKEHQQVGFQGVNKHDYYGANELRSIEEEEFQYKESIAELPRVASPSNYKVNHDYHENLMRNIEVQIQRVFSIISQRMLSPRGLNSGLEERKRETFKQKAAAQLINSRRSQTPMNREKIRTGLKDSFNNGGGTGSASGVNQYFVSGQNISNNPNITKGSHASLYHPQNFGVSPGSIHGQLLPANETLNNGNYYATETSKDEINHESSNQINQKKIVLKEMHELSAIKISQEMPRSNSRYKTPQMNKLNSASNLMQLSYQHDSHYQDLSGIYGHGKNAHNMSQTRSAAYSQTKLQLDQTTRSDNQHYEEPQKWMPNEKFTSCQICTKSFGIIRRKHHCRSCGILVCSGCSPEKAYVAGYKDKKVRICKNCDLINQRRKTETSKLRVFTSAKTSRR
eukprot:403371108